MKKIVTIVIAGLLLFSQLALPVTAQTGKLSMVWHYSSEAPLDRAKYLDVASPNWLSLQEDLSIKDYGLYNYVKNAHALGMKVHPRLVGLNDPGWPAAAIFNDKDKRKIIVDNVLAVIAEYKGAGAPLDGINLDFEAIGPEATAGYVLMVQELSAAVKAQGLVFSIDVPGLTSGGSTSVWSGGFDFDALGAIPGVDYIAIMAYDWVYGAPKSYVRSALAYATQHIPKNKVLLGVPLYSRDYIFDDAADSTPYGKIRAYGKYYYSNALTLLNTQGANPQSVWDEELGLTRVTYTRPDNSKHLMFLEDSNSLRVKLDLVNEFGAAGMAAWRFYNEDPKIWQVIGEKMGKVAPAAQPTVPTPQLPAQPPIPPAPSAAPVEQRSSKSAAATPAAKPKVVATRKIAPVTAAPVVNQKKEEPILADPALDELISLRQNMDSSLEAGN